MIIDKTCVDTPELRADERLMFTITKIVQYSAGPTRVVSPDANIFVSLLYHVKNTWHGLELFLLKKGQLKEDKHPQNELYSLKA